MPHFVAVIASHLGKATAAATTAAATTTAAASTTLGTVTRQVTITTTPKQKMETKIN